MSPICVIDRQSKNISKQEADMRLFKSLFLILFLLSCFSFAQAQENKATGFLADFAWQIHFVQGRLMDLQQAVPQDKYNWRPAEGIRSVGETYLHAAMGNYYFIKFSGLKVPADISLEGGPPKWDKSTTDKAEINKVLQRSFSDLLAQSKNITNEDLDKMVNAFGMEMSIRNLMIGTLNHLHEHLGQSIAYARSNGIAPPWSVKKESKEEN